MPASSEESTGIARTCEPSSRTAVSRRSRDLPVMISVVDTEDKLSLAAEAVEEMIQDGLIVVSDVDIVRLVHSQIPPEAPDANLPAR